MKKWFLFAMTLPISLAASDIDEAKSLLAGGQRRAALEKLDHAKSVSKSKGQLRDIAEKRRIFVEQFLTAEAFQAFQEAKGYGEVERWTDCLAQLDGIAPGDQDNLSVLRLRVRCQNGSGQLEGASKTLDRILGLVPGDVQAVLDGAEIALAQKKFTQGLEALHRLQPRSSEEIERHAVLKSRFLAGSGRASEATDVLKQDQETHLEHVLVLYELASLYARLPGHDWPARKYLSLFISRCKRMPEGDPKAREVLPLVPKAQQLLLEINKKLGV